MFRKALSGIYIRRQLLTTNRKEPVMAVGKEREEKVRVITLLESKVQKIKGPLYSKRDLLAYFIEVFLAYSITNFKYHIFTVGLSISVRKF
jgi:hypothetical protein